MLRTYQDSDYEALKDLYLHSEWCGGQYDEARDSREKLAEKIKDDPSSVWLYEQGGKLAGTISLIDDGRVAWLFRFVVKDNDNQVAKELYKKALSVFKERGHLQVLVYSPADDKVLDRRYKDLGMNKGHNFTAYWSNI